MTATDSDTRPSVRIIAEIGNNHEGDISVAEDMLQAAAACGVDAVKFQTFQTEWFVPPSDAARVERMNRFELSADEFSRLATIAKGLGVDFISTPLDLPSVDVLMPIVDAFKIASGDNNFYPLISKCCATGKELIVSTGVSDLAQVRQTKAFIEDAWDQLDAQPNLTVLHCVSNYPTADGDANLLAIDSLRSLDCDIGYSDHTLGIEACCLAVALGACVIEKHFTLDKNYSDFRDHAIAADPTEMAALVQAVRKAERMLGTGCKVVCANERDMQDAIRRSIVAARNLEAGHLIQADDLTWMRPGAGIAPGNEHLLIGQTLDVNVPRGEPILKSQLRAQSTANESVV